MKKKFFLFYGILFWLPSKIAATVLTVISLVATSGAAVDAVDVETSINPLPVYKGRRENVPRGRPDRLVWAVENCTTRRLS